MEAQMLALKSLRKSLNMTTQEMAKEIGISKSFYEKIEFGVRRASNEFCNKIKQRYPFLDINIFFNK